MRGFGLLGVIGALLIAGIAGVIGYQIGLSAQVAEAGATVLYAPWGAGAWADREHQQGGSRPVPPPVDAMLADWHRQAHDTGAPRTGPGSAPTADPPTDSSSAGRGGADRAS
jgi:hypothetical protein